MRKSAVKGYPTRQALSHADVCVAELLLDVPYPVRDSMDVLTATSQSRQLSIIAEDKTLLVSFLMTIHNWGYHWRMDGRLQERTI